MENFITWFEIPSKDFSRAVTFYKAVLNVEIEEADFFGTKMGFLPSDGKNVSGAIVYGDDYKPSSDGVLAYLNGGNDLQPMLSRVEANNGKVIVPKTLISEEMGYFALFIDTEGNKLGIHSMN